MLVLNNIVKDYPSGDGFVRALDGVSLHFRKSEFVSILGQSGCGKTTLLNIVGGLDRYTQGDLVIQGKSTKSFKDRDWDNYRNHSVGFVFQSYNLIPHQSALRNVELALTLSGVSKAQRRKRAVEALEQVGLGDQLYKKPAQMSGGQAQRVAIARALVNDPQIILADEPTGALDTETSVQIMEILKKISQDRLILMVTHNPELAQTYSTRIIRLVDGRVTADSNPFEGEGALRLSDKKKKAPKKPSMSFFTALGLSLNNLMTKKARTFLTSFAGSIGIIGIALILSISTGVNAYINTVQEHTLSSSPIRLQAKSVDMSAMISTMMGLKENQENPDHALDAVYASPVMYQLMNSLNSMETNTNNLKAFKQYLENNKSLTDAYASCVEYIYDFDFHILTKDPAGKIVKSDILEMMQELYGGNISMDSASSMMSGVASQSLAAFEVWEQLLPGRVDAQGKPELVSPLLKEQYTLVSGEWPTQDTDLVLVVNPNHEVSDFVLFALGLKTLEEMKEDLATAAKGEQLDVTENRWTYQELMEKEFRLALAADCYSLQAATNTYTDLLSTQAGLSLIYNGENTLNLRISAIVTPNEDATANMLTGTIGYTSALTDRLMAASRDHSLIAKQLASPTVDVLTGLPFRDAVTELTQQEKIEKLQAYLSGLNQEEKAKLFIALSGYVPLAQRQALVEQTLQTNTRAQLEAMVVEAYLSQTGMEDAQAVAKNVAAMSQEDLENVVAEIVSLGVQKAAAQQAQTQLAGLSVAQLAAMLDAAPLSQEQALWLYDQHVPAPFSQSTYEENLALLGYVDPQSPSQILLYASTFENKEKLSDMIADYNAGAAQEDVIQYTDLMAIMMSGITTIIDAISYVLIAFVSVSLVVSSIMIGIITYISVLERTKEIGILRAIGASKRDISRVFNAETVLVGFCAGVIGIGSTLLLLLPINAIIRHVTQINILNAFLPPVAAVILVVISMVLTIVAGFFPSRLAAKKDPVVALRSE